MYNIQNILILCATLILTSCENSGLTDSTASGTTPSSMTWGQDYNDFGYSSIQANDGGFVTVGSTYNPETGSDGVWIYTNGTFTDTTFQILDIEGNAKDDQYNDVIKADDGGYLIAGTTFQSGTTSDIFIYKVDKDGAKVWDPVLLGSATDASSQAIVETFTGDYVLVGHQMAVSGASKLIYVPITDNGTSAATFGTVVGDFTTSVDGGDLDKAYDLDTTVDGDIIIVGDSRSEETSAATDNTEEDSDIYVEKVQAGASGTVVKFFGSDNEDEHGRSIQQTSDGGYIIAGFTYSEGSGQADGWLIKTDASLNQDWNQAYGSIYDDKFYSSIQTTDGGFAALGSSYDSEDQEQVWVLKVDASGNKEWERRFGKSLADYGASIEQTNDGGFIISGSQYSATTQSDIWIIKLDIFGN